MIKSKLNLILFYIFIICLFVPAFAQKQLKWEQKTISYLISNPYEKRDYNFTVESASDIIIKPVINSYWFFISDVDGVNCAFHPSCSEFFLEAVKETNAIQGTLMFFDRFTRDSNFLRREDRYPRIKNGKFYDPPDLYTLDKNIIVYIPLRTLIDH